VNPGACGAKILGHAGSVSATWRASDPETLAAEQQHLYDPIEATMAAWSDRVCSKNDTAEN
jgi:chaperone required for assembly of F1-ATPase